MLSFPQRTRVLLGELILFPSAQKSSVAVTGTETLEGFFGKPATWGTFKAGALDGNEIPVPGADDGKLAACFLAGGGD